jgi:hypothetical protein
MQMNVKNRDFRTSEAARPWWKPFDKLLKTANIPASALMAATHLTSLSLI